MSDRKSFGAQSPRVSPVRGRVSTFYSQLTDYDRLLHSIRDAFVDESGEMDGSSLNESFGIGHGANMSRSPPPSNPSTTTIENSSASDTSNHNASEITAPLDVNLSSYISTSNELDSVGLSNQGSVDAEIERINRFCESIENNLASIGIYQSSAASSPLSSNTANRNNENMSASTPLGRRVTAQDGPVEVIDLSNFEFTDEPSTRQIPIIDLCTPEGPRQTYRNMSNREFNLAARRRRVNSTLNETDAIPKEVIVIGGADASPPKRARLDDTMNNDDSYKCPVCLEAVRARQPVSTKCGHVFCNTCIQSAIRSTRKCPMCNKKMTAGQIFRIYL